MKNVSRRRFLASQGAMLTLPFLPSLAGAAKVAKPSKKFVMFYVPNGIVRRTFFPGEEKAELPGFMGGFSADKKKVDMAAKLAPGVHPLQLTETMQPMAPHIKDISLVSGLERTYQDGQDVHAQAASCFLTSVSPEQAIAKGWKHPNGRSLDQIMGDKLGHTTAYKTLQISCNGFRAGKEPIHFNNISWYGPERIAPSIKDPRKLYARLFMRSKLRSHVADVTDLVLADAKTMSKRLGREDRATMDEYMTMIRDIEVRIAKLEKMLKGANIAQPTDAILPRGEYIKVQADLMLVALQMGITNISTFMIGPERWEATLTYDGLFDKPVNHHQFTHNQKGEGYKNAAKIDLFHMQQYAYILERMKGMKESDGTSMLDNSLVSYVAGVGDGATHQYFDLPFILAGGAQGQIKQGRHIRCKGGTHNSNMWLTQAKLMGLDIDSFADSTGVISELWT